MASGHTDRATVNARRPLTVTMVDVLRRHRIVSRLQNPTTAEKNARRALIDRGYLAESAPMGGLYVTPAGEAALRVFEDGP